MPFLSSGFLSYLLGPGILRNTSYDLCSREYLRTRALCPERSEPSLARAPADRHLESWAPAQLCMMKPGEASPKRWHLKGILQNDWTWVKWRTTLEGGRRANRVGQNRFTAVRARGTEFLNSHTNNRKPPFAPHPVCKYRRVKRVSCEARSSVDLKAGGVLEMGTCQQGRRAAQV